VGGYFRFFYNEIVSMLPLFYLFRPRGARKRRRVTAVGRLCV